VALLTTLGSAGLACGGGVAVLGDAAPRRYHFGPPQVVAELSDGSKNDNPTLSADLLELAFTSDRSGNSDVWLADRATASAPFGPPVAVTAANSSSFETSAALAADGLTLWFGSDRAGGLGDLDIWAVTRPTRGDPWSQPALVPSLSSVGKDLPRPPGQHGLVMPLSSDRAMPTVYQTYLAARDAPGGAFGAPTVISELVLGTGVSTVDGFLTDDGLTLFFSSATSPTPSDLYVAWRKSVTQPFSVYVPLDELNTATGDERDPWLSPDGTQFYFVSDRDGHLDIYLATASRDAEPVSL
jgi:hypothetical protein